MKTKCLFLFLLFQLHHCIGQEVEKEVPYFVMAYVFTEDDFEIEDDNINGVYTKKPISLLLNINNNRFKIIDTLSSKYGYMFFMTNISEQKYLYFEERYHLRVNCLTILDYSKGVIKRRFRPKWDKNFNGSFSPPWAILKNNSILIYNEWKSKGVPYMGYGRDINFKRIKFEIKDIENIYSEGTAGYEHAGLYPQFYYYNEEKKQLRYWTDKSGSELLTKIQIPDSLTKSCSNDLAIRINNFNYLAGYFVNYEPGFNDTIGQGRIYNKKTGVWQRMDILGINPSFKNWEDWIYGTARTRSINIKWYDEKIAKKLKKRYDYTYGNMPNIAIYPGILYLYHIPTNKMIKWYPGDRDSEIITIHEGTIYYRVFDEIRTVELDTIKNEINWPSQRLLIKDKKRVPNIHWMFFAPKQDKVEEVWVNRPKD